MTRQRSSDPALDAYFVELAEDRAARAAASCIHWNPCSGFPPLLIEAPLRYFGTQALVGLLSLMVLTVL